MDNRFQKIFTGDAVDRPPFWLMRQAGRYLPEYRELRAKAGSFLQLCFNPEYAAEVSLQPLRRYDMDAAIMFADILLIPMALGIPLKFEHGEGPKLGAWQIEKLQFDESKLEPIYQTLKLLRASPELKTKTLIGFAGAPWTVATYIIEGGSSKNFMEVKKLAINEPKKFQQLIDILTESTTKYLISQIKAGAQCLQIFDSWSGELADDEFEKWVIKPTAKIIAAIKSTHPNIPIIGFPRRSNFTLKTFVEQTKVDAISIDHTVPLDWAFQNLPCVIQGNLDNIILLANQEAIKQATQKILTTAHGKKFIFNLGHGVLQQTSPENVGYLADIIKNFKA